MNDQAEELLRAGIWLGPAVLGTLCYRVLAHRLASGDDLAGAMVLAIAAVILTILGTRFNKDLHPTVAPAVFAAMFLASLSMR